MMLYNRSSNPKEKGLIMANSVGVIDKDYYENPDNDGHFMFAFIILKEEDIILKRRSNWTSYLQKYLVTVMIKQKEKEIGGFGSN